MKNKYSVICPRCGATNPMNQKRCINCGARLPSPQIAQNELIFKKWPANNSVLAASIILLVIVVIILVARNQVGSNRTVSYNPVKMQLLNRQQQVVRTIYYTKKVEQTKGNNVYGQIALISKRKISQSGYPLKKAYQQAKHHYSYHLNLAHHQAEVKFEGHNLTFKHMEVNNGSWIKKSPMEPLRGYQNIKYYRYFYLDDY